MSHVAKYNKFDEMTYAQTWNPASGQEAWSNAGGYGFWCNKTCADRKDAEIDAAQQERDAQKKLEDELIRKSQQPQIAIAGMGSGTVISIIAGSLLLLGVGTYFILKKAKAK